MKWNKHYGLTGHAILSPSQSAWVNYDAEKLINFYTTVKATEQGTKLHEWAAKTIELGIKMPRTKSTINMYVNDAIGFGMTPEQLLRYSENCFGTADAICFRKNILRIHDLKTGTHKASFRQLLIYAAIFCLEYTIDPNTLDGCELRIYQSNEIRIDIPKPETILAMMGTIITADKLIEDQKY